MKGLTCSVQLFRERLLEKVHSTIRKSIVGGFEFTACSLKISNLKEFHDRDLCSRVLEESNKSKSDS